MKTPLIAMFLSLSLASAAFAQQPPPPEGGGEGPRGGPEDRRGPGGPGGQGGQERPGRPGMREGGGPGMGGGMGGPPGMGGPNDPRIAKFEMLRGYLEIVERLAHLTRDPQASGVAAVISASDILRPRGADTAIDYFNKLLPEVKSPMVQRAIRIQLVDFYKAAGQQDKAMDLLKDLMIANPATGAVPEAPEKQ